MYEDARYAWLLGLEQGSKDYKAGKERADNIMQSSKYELNQFGFEEYGEKEKGWWKNNDSIIICNTKQDIADFYRDHVHKNHMQDYILENRSRARATDLQRHRSQYRKFKCCHYKRV